MMEDADVVIEQAVFGYDDGHRLLECSSAFPREVERALLPLSDRAPGMTDGDFEPYWTGVGLEGEKYALMKTWPATELPRPGCVWTHVLVLSAVDLKVLPDLRVLQELVRRPAQVDTLGAYKHGLMLSAARLAGGVPWVKLGRRKALQLLRHIYAGGPLSASNPADLEEGIFALWSQQWPRLRRSLSFRTCKAHAVEAAAFIIQPSNRFSVVEETLAEAPWERLVLADLAAPGETREFLWRFGEDIDRGRDRFQFLVELYLVTRQPTLAGERLDNLLVKVGRALPTPDDGATLKRELMGESVGPTRLLPAADVVELWRFLLGRPEASAFAVERIGGQLSSSAWTEQVEDIVAIAESAATREAPPGLIAALAEGAEPEAFWNAAVQNEVLWRTFVPLNPALLGAPGARRLHDRQLAELVGALRVKEVGFLVGFTQMDLRRPETAAVLATKWPSEILLAVKKCGDARRPIDESWLVRELAEPLLDDSARAISEARSTRVLAAYARILGYDSTRAIETGPLPWAAALKVARDDITGTERQVLLAFFLVLGIEHPARGVEPLFECAFAEMHEELRGARLCYQASSLLERHLPEVSFWQRWDLCNRLRIAVARSYVDTGLAVESFAELAEDEYTRARLFEAARDRRAGRKYLQAVGL